MDENISVTQRKILTALCTNGGEYQSLFQLAVDINLDYHWVWLNVLSLAWAGFVVAERSASRGRGYKVRIPCGAVWPDVTSVKRIQEDFRPIGQSISSENIYAMRNTQDMA
jgi:hypothetical protein